MWVCGFKAFEEKISKRVAGRGEENKRKKNKRREKAGKGKKQKKKKRKQGKKKRRKRAEVIYLHFRVFDLGGMEWVIGLTY